MTSSESYQLNPGWVNDTNKSPTPPINSDLSSGSAPQTSHEALTSVQEMALPEEDELQLLKRLGYAYQVLASSIVRAKQAQQDLRSKLNLYKHAIDVRQQELKEVLAQLTEHPNPIMLPAGEAELAAEIAQLKDRLKGSDYESLLVKLNQMQAAVDTDRQNLPELLNRMRSELDLVILQVSRLSALENLSEAYKKHRQFQEYNARAEQEFQSLAKAFSLS